ncbi:hypothetical protein [Streptomyces sp. NBC_00198]|uniref:hypothetical protein n=1 Tax=Streptomyces sp. NBC_00198 TaxID=2975677 RepID=UPI00225A45D9|nr:hypothetical protein [Streptomyces sp. NBC_00198]MCX5280602.1 hypothetical protein [Streptomyces sp. NBC_00198]
MAAAEKEIRPGRGAAEPRAGDDPGRGVPADAGGARPFDRPSRLKPAEGVPADEAAVIAANQVEAAVAPDRIE